MHILVYEYLTGGGHPEVLSLSMTQEGEKMVMALVSDLLALPGITLTLLRDHQLPDFALSNERLKIRETHPSATGLEHLEGSLASVDAVWPIAPESDNCLERICRLIERSGKRLLSTSSEGVALMGKKRETLNVLKNAAIPVVSTVLLQDLSGWQRMPFPLVFKRNDGAGCEDTIIIQNPSEKDAFMEMPGHHDWIVQPLIQGDVLSLSGIFHQGQGRLLSCNRQHVHQTDHGFHLCGITIGALDNEPAFKDLLSGIAAALPTLWGFAGVDLVYDVDGPKVLEVNPRLTSAYPGILTATGWNPAALVLDLAQNGLLPPMLDPLTSNPTELRWSNFP